MKNATESRSIRLEQVEKRKCELEDRTLETIQSKENKLKRMKASEESLHELQDTIKRNNLRIIEDPK